MENWIFNSPAILTAEVHHGDGEIALGVPLTEDFDHAVTLANIFDRLFSVQMLTGLIDRCQCSWRERFGSGTAPLNVDN